MADESIPRLYYSIREVADLIGEKPHVLRYWETEFEALSPRKSRAGKRVYTEEDLAVVRRIQSLLRDERYTIAGARRILEAERGKKPGAKPAGPDLRRELLELRVFLEKLLESL
jgi:DNA-binding transcriptional MerR regulator